MQRVVRLAILFEVVTAILQLSNGDVHRGSPRNARCSMRFSTNEDALTLHYGLYEVQEEMLIKRGIYEEQLMSSKSGSESLLKANKVKGVGGGQKGFGGGAASSKSRFAVEAMSHARVLRKEGVVRVDNVLSVAFADKMRDFVLELRQDSLDEAAAGALQYSERFADVLLRSNRSDLKLPLGDNGSIKNPVLAALHCILCQSSVKDIVTAVLTDQAVLYELSCLISDPGSHRQVVHPDNPVLTGRGDPTLLTCFIALQDVDMSMGPTIFLPGTHTATAHAAFADESIPTGQSESPKDELLGRTKSVVSTLSKGSAAVFDSRLLHCGSANRSLDTRAIFYFSFRNPEVAYPGNPASIRSDLGTAHITLQGLTDAVIATHENGAANTFAY